MSTPDDWMEDARIERHRIRERPDPQTGFMPTEDLFWTDEPEDEELSENDE